MHDNRGINGADDCCPCKIVLCSTSWTRLWPCTDLAKSTSSRTWNRQTLTSLSLWCIDQSRWFHPSSKKYTRVCEELCPSRSRWLNHRRQLSSYMKCPTMVRWCQTCANTCTRITYWRLCSATWCMDHRYTCNPGPPSKGNRAMVFAWTVYPDSCCRNKLTSCRPMVCYWRRVDRQTRHSRGLARRGAKIRRTSLCPRSCA